MKANRVLFVDDNTDATELFVELFNLCGIQAVGATRPDQALSVAAQFRPEVVFLDIQMPAMSGFELAVALKALPGMSDSRFVALTGMNLDRIGDQVRAAGFETQVQKPASVDSLLRLVSELS